MQYKRIRSVIGLTYEESRLEYARNEFIRFDCGAIILCTSGTCVLDTGVATYAVEPRTALMFSTWSLLKASDCSGDFHVRIILFPKERFMDAAMPLDMAVFNYTHSNPCCRQCGEGIDLWMDMAQMLFLDSMSDFRYSRQDARFLELEEKNYLQGLFLWIRRRLKTVGVEISQERSKAGLVCHRFMSLVHEYAATEHNVSFYSEKLGVSQRYLNKATVEYIDGRSPKKIIDDQVIVEIKSRLRDPELSVTRIAADMHFSDRTYMSSFFRKHTGISPSDFRNNDNK